MRMIFILLLSIFSLSASATDDLSDALKDLTRSIIHLKQKLSAQDPVINTEQKPFIKSYSFEPRKLHRMLDTTARLISYELSLSGASVATSWERDHSKNLNLVISFNFSYSQKNRVYNALKKIVKNSYSFGGTVKDASKTIAIKTEELKVVFDQIKNCDEKDFEKLRTKYISIRKEIDHLKLYVLLVKKEKNRDEQQIAQFYNNVSPHSVNVLSNRKRIHSELNIVQYFLNGDFFIGKISLDNKDIPYIYIGNSLRSCSKCASLIDGEKTAGIRGINEFASDKELHRLFFYRSAQSHCYPRSYFVPWWSCQVNEKNPDELRQCFAEKLHFLDPKEKAKTFFLKTLPMSDAED